MDSNSAAMIQTSITPFAMTSPYYNTTFSNTGYGMALAYASASDKVYAVQCTKIGYNTPSCSPVGSVSFPIPAGTQAATGTDGHLAIVYQADDGSQYAQKELDMWQAHYDQANDTWSASTVTVVNLFGWGAACAEGQYCNGPVSAGFAGLGGAVRPEEIAQGHIDHALALAVPLVRTTYIACPATHTDGNTSALALPEGALVYLDSSYDVDVQPWPLWLKIVGHALQNYGAYVRDHSPVLILFGVTDQNSGVPQWSSVGVPYDYVNQNETNYGDLNQLPWNQLHVAKMTSCN